jgi:hypothetical protein
MSMIEQTQGPRVLRAKAAAEYLGVAPQTMARWRVEGRGPRFTKCGAAVVYQLRELEQFIERNTRRSTSETVLSDGAADGSAAR